MHILLKTALLYHPHRSRVVSHERSHERSSIDKLLSLCDTVPTRKLIRNVSVNSDHFHHVLSHPLQCYRVAQKANLPALWIKFNFCRIKFAMNFPCVKTSSGKVVVAYNQRSIEVGGIAYNM